jgi:hypothetical protein
LDAVDSDWKRLLFAVRRSIRYHRRRMRFFDQLGKWNSGLSVVFGSTAAASILTGASKALSSACAIVVVVVQTIDLLVGSGKVARDHSDLARRFVALESEMIVTAPSPESLKALEVKRLAIEADEPAIYRTLDVLCHNEQARADGHPSSELWDVPRLQRTLAHIISFDTAKLMKLP